MFINFTEKEDKFTELMEYANKIKNKALKNACLKILNDYKSELFVRGAGHDGIEHNRENQNFL